MKNIIYVLVTDIFKDGNEDNHNYIELPGNMGIYKVNFNAYLSISRPFHMGDNFCNNAVKGEIHENNAGFEGLTMCATANIKIRYEIRIYHRDKIKKGLNYYWNVNQKY